MDFLALAFYCSIGKSEKEFTETILVDSGLVFANYGCVCKTVFLKLTVFQILFRISQSNGRKEIEKQISYRTGQRTEERGWRTLSISQLPIGHFRVPKALTFKLRLSAQPLLRKWVLFAWEWKIISISSKSHNGISKAEYLTSFWNRGPGELGNGLPFHPWHFTGLPPDFLERFCDTRISSLIKILEWKRNVNKFRKFNFESKDQLTKEKDWILICKV